MDETHRRTFRPLPEVRWSAVATGALLGAAVWLVLLRFGDVPRALLLEEEPGLGRQVWWVVAPLLAAGVAAWTGASASGERGILGAYLHGLLAWAGALLLAAVVGPGSIGVLPQPGWSGLATVVGAVVGAALGRALLAGRLTAPRGLHGSGRLAGSSEASQVRSRWREVLTARRGAPEGRRPGAHDDMGRPDQDLH
ncbi:hypothetical protein NR798_05715 [Archangium gephyra]|uniref:hypothetical protein n=1 Tax=Archangium gephyra TaxID=48 RepID=UPI0035D41D93